MVSLGVNDGEVYLGLGGGVAWCGVGRIVPGIAFEHGMLCPAVEDLTVGLCGRGRL